MWRLQWAFCRKQYALLHQLDDGELLLNMFFWGFFFGVSIHNEECDTSIPLLFFSFLDKFARTELQPAIVPRGGVGWVRYLVGHVSVVLAGHALPDGTLHATPTDFWKLLKGSRRFWEVSMTWQCQAPLGYLATDLQIYRSTVQQTFRRREEREVCPQSFGIRTTFLLTSVMQSTQG